MAAANKCPAGGAMGGGGQRAMAIGVHGAGVLMREDLMAIALIGEARLDQLRKACASL